VKEQVARSVGGEAAREQTHLPETVLRRHDDAGRQIADPERRGHQIIREHEEIKRKEEIEVNTLVIEKVKAAVFEAIVMSKSRSDEK
jgi:hypothetical protein